MTTLYEISNLTSGHSFGAYEGSTPEDAWKALCEDAGDPTAERGNDIAITEVVAKPEYYETVTVGGVECRGLTEDGAEEAERRGLTVDVDAYGCAFALDSAGEVVDLDADLDEIYVAAAPGGGLAVETFDNAADAWAYCEIAPMLRVFALPSGTKVERDSGYGWISEIGRVVHR